MSYEYVEVERVSDDGLTRQRWKFWLNGLTLVLDRYVDESRPSKRHTFSLITVYSRLPERHSQATRLSMNAAPFPQDVADEALRLIVSRIVVSKVR